ncbi:30S ribosome-binding factor RbfA [Thermodesulfobacterium sp. TA1]|uniref:30S ribosome-binding factor RbfA n=1 Tax=Thermodesulfobacterium sp. TA1 TaxID=2234087 RepID=UPI001231C0DA|nr:30S ribosome-binding factor RbfA [Thermodesulfobacterium sp. TA1]QER42048.1 30S ribosome-binding factor RbfA [Thermodesulfobacterium sp. TA1]
MSYRPEKVGSLLQEVITEILMYDLSDPVFKQLITITEVKIGGDLRKAVVFFRVYGEIPAEEVKEAFNRAKGYIKKLIGEKITLKYMPDLEFKLDDREEKERQLDSLFAKISKSKGDG